MSNDQFVIESLHAINNSLFSRIAELQNKIAELDQVIMQYDINHSNCIPGDCYHSGYCDKN